MFHRTLKRAAGACVVLGLLVAGTAWWASSLRRDNGQQRVTGVPFTRPGGALFGGPVPGPDGRVVGSKGTVVYLPVMPPDRPDSIQRAATAQAWSALKTCFWPGPSARPGVYSTDPDAFPFENQFADTGTTYMWGSFKLPEHAKLVLKGRFPHMRHWNFVLYTPDGGFPTNGVSDAEINPDAGSSNPFRAGVRRDVSERSYTVQIVSGKAPAEPLANTLYTYSEAGKAVPVVMRNYVPDAGADVLGSVGLPEVQLQYDDGRTLSGEAACAATNTEFRGKRVPVTLSQSAWRFLTHALSSDAMLAPAHDFTAEGMETFFNRYHLVFKLFMPRLAALDKQPSHMGGWYANAATRYGYKFLNHRLGEVYAVRGKLPLTPLTYHSDGSPARKAEMLYWSMCSNMGLATGMNIDCLYDEQLEPLLDSERHYTIAISRLADRPANASAQCGVAWMEFGNGDGVEGGSPDTMLLVNRETQVDPAFKHSWFSVQRPGSEHEALGDYQPQLINLRKKAAFEALGCPVDAKKLDAMVAAATPH